MSAEKNPLLEKPKVSEKLRIEKRTQNGKEIYFVLDPDKPSWAFINQHGLSVLKLCNGKNSIDEIATTIGNDYGISFKEVLGGVQAFLKHLADAKVLQQDIQTDKKNGSSQNSFHSLVLEITRECNLNCSHCFLSAGSSAAHELTFSEIKEIIRQTKEIGGTSLSIGGGEPLLRADCFEIIEYALSLDLLVALGTNGVLIDERLAEKLAALPIKIQISLDGATAATHDAIRGENSFEATLRGINHLIQAGKINDLVIAFTPMATNIDELPQFIDMMLKLGIYVVQFPPLSRSGRARKNWEKLKLSDEKRLWLWKYIAERSELLEGRMHLLAECFSMDINNASGTPHRCSIGSQVRIDPQGNAYPCQCFHFGTDYRIGNVRKQALAEIVQGQALKSIVTTCFNRPYQIESCRQCQWINMCGGGCMGSAYETHKTVLSADACRVRKKWIEGLFEERIRHVLRQV